MKSKINKLLMLLLVAGFIKVHAQGMESQYVPGLQVGSNKVKVGETKTKFGASLAVMEFDHVGHRMYYNIGLTDGYYRLTQMNKQKKNERDSIKPLKSNGQIFGMRWGMVFGKGEFQRIGFSLNGSFSSLNVAEAYTYDRLISYGSVGGGLVYYNRIGKSLNVMLKGGFEKLKGKKNTVDGRLIYFESTIGYELFQKFGVSVSPCFYSRKLNCIAKVGPSGSPADLTLTDVKASQFVLKIGIAKFLR